MDGSVGMLNRHKGFTLIELLVTLVIGSIGVAILLTIMKNAFGLSDQLKLKLDSQTYVNAFINNFHDDVESAGYVDYSTTDLNSSSVNSASSICPPDSNDILIQTSIPESGAYRVDERILYVKKIINPSRSLIHPGELGIYKYVNINGIYNVGQSDANALVLAGVKSFNCSCPKDGPMVVDCKLTVYRSLMSDDTDTFEIYASNDNLLP